jgi:hypothetical protein
VASEHPKPYAVRKHPADGGGNLADGAVAKNPQPQNSTTNNIK